MLDFESILYTCYLARCRRSISWASEKEKQKKKKEEEVEELKKNSLSFTIIVAIQRKSILGEIKMHIFAGVCISEENVNQMYSQFSEYGLLTNKQLLWPKHCSMSGKGAGRAA